MAFPANTKYKHNEGNTTQRQLVTTRFPSKNKIARPDGNLPPKKPGSAQSGKPTGRP
jgi:hypothetical protein